MNLVIQRALKIVGSQKRLADKCGVTQPAVHKWLKGGLVSPEKVTAFNSHGPHSRRNAGIQRA